MLPIKPIIKPLGRVIKHLDNFENKENKLLLCEIDFETLKN